MRASLPQLGVASGADDKIRLDPALALRAHRLFLGDVLQQGFLFQSPGVGLRQSLLGTQDEVDEQAQRPEDQDHQSGEELGEDVPRPQAHIAEGPNDQAHPKGRRESADESDDS